MPISRAVEWLERDYDEGMQLFLFEYDDVTYFRACHPGMNLNIGPLFELKTDVEADPFEYRKEDSR